jgi:hypothetical protein
VSTPRGPALGELIRSVPFDRRDAFIDELLGIEGVPADADLPAGAVPYLPCGVDEILAFAGEIAPTDRIAVLGSGLGRAAFLLHLLSGAATYGIEIQAHLVDRARVIAARLDLPVTFVHANLVDVELEASVVFLYAPCNGAMLDRVIDRIEALAERRPILIGAVGLELDHTWVVPRASASPGLSIYASCVA